MDSKLLSDVALAFVAREEFGVRLSKVLKLLCTSMRLSRVYVYFDGQNQSTMGYIHEWCAQGVVHQWMQDVPYSLYPGVTRELAQNGGIVASDVSKLPTDARAMFEPYGIQAMLAWPIEVDQEIAGFTGFDDCSGRRSWTDEEVALLKAAAALISVFSEREILLEQFRSGKAASGGSAAESSIRDPLTGVYNQRYILDRLVGFDAEYARLGRNYCVSVLGINDFEMIRDSFGAAAGDLLLKEFAVIVDASIRHYDIAGRLEGEEFVIVSVNSEAAEVVPMMDRIRDIVGSRAFDIDGQEIRIVFSSGIVDSSEFTPEEFSIEKMVETARQRRQEAARE